MHLTEILYCDKENNPSSTVLFTVKHLFKFCWLFSFFCKMWQNLHNHTFFTRFMPTVHLHTFFVNIRLAQRKLSLSSKIKFFLNLYSIKTEIVHLLLNCIYSCFDQPPTNLSPQAALHPHNPKKRRKQTNFLIMSLSGLVLIITLDS